MQHFTQNFLGRSTYICGLCSKRTRDTGRDEASVDLCAFCYQEAGLENSLSDGNITEAQFNVRIAALKKQYKR
jgi:hypothetical protein